jgi:ribosomal protein L16 Arg81 hydroxylase
MSSPIEIIEAQSRDQKFRFETFASLVWPKSREQFFDDHWEKKPFFVQRDIPGFFDTLLRLEDVDEYLGTRAFRQPDIRLVKQGKDKNFEEYSKDGVADRAKVMQAFRSGTMLLFSHLNRHHLPLAELVSRCEAETHVPMRSNVYMSPPGSQGFKLHWDTHDVLILQVSGSKRWHLYDSPLVLPHEDQMRELKDWVGKANKLTEVVLRPGSVLFLPRGYIHGAESESEHSLHITLGLRSLTVADIVLAEFRRKSLLDVDMRKVARFEDLEDEERLEMAKNALRRVIEQLDIAAAANEVYKSFIRSRQPPARGVLTGAIAHTELDHGTELQLRDGALFQTFRSTDTLSLAVDGAVVELPLGVEPAVQHVIANRTFRASELPGLEYESRLILAKTLLECRLVEHA